MMLQNVVKTNMFSTAFGSVSMGQGQEVHARRLIGQCQQNVSCHESDTVLCLLQFACMHAC